MHVSRSTTSSIRHWCARAATKRQVEAELTLRILVHLQACGKARAYVYGTDMIALTWRHAMQRAHAAVPTAEERTRWSSSRRTLAELYSASHAYLDTRKQSQHSLTVADEWVGLCARCGRR
jgi:hypothetical protein